MHSTGPRCSTSPNCSPHLCRTWNAKQTRPATRHNNRPPPPQHRGQRPSQLILSNFPNTVERPPPSVLCMLPSGGQVRILLVFRHLVAKWEYYSSYIWSCSLVAMWGYYSLLYVGLLFFFVTLKCFSVIWKSILYHWKLFSISLDR